MAKQKIHKLKRPKFVKRHRGIRKTVRIDCYGIDQNSLKGKVSLADDYNEVQLTNHSTLTNPE